MTPTLRQLIWRALVPVLLIDQLLKVWIKTSFTVGERMDFVPGILELQFIENEGMAFGWALPGVAGKLLLTGFRLAAAVAIGVYISRRVKEEAPNGVLYSLTLVWAGALGNIIDSAVYGQIFGRSGWFPVESLAGREVFPPIWNLADAAICVSVIWMLLNQRRYFPAVK